MSDTLPLFVGLDYHQQAVQVCVLDAQGRQLLNRPLDNDSRAIAAAVAQLGTVQRAGIESCSGAADLAQELADQCGWSIDLAHPGYVNRMKQSPDKSDYSDGRMIADLVRVGYLPKVWLAPEPIRELRRMVRHRAALVNERRAAKQRINAILREQRLRCVDHSRWSKAWMNWLCDVAPLSPAGRWIIDHQLQHLRHLCGEIQEAEKQLTLMTRADLTVKKLKTLPGIGEVTAWIVRASIGRFDRFARDRWGRLPADEARAIRSLRHRQAAVALLRPVPTQRLQRHACRRRGSDQGRRSAAAGDDDRDEPPADPHRAALARVG